MRGDDNMKITKRQLRRIIKESKGWFLLGLDGTLAKSQKTRTPIWWSDEDGAQRAYDNGYGGEGAVPVEILLVPDMYAYNGSDADPADLESVRQHWAPGTLNKVPSELGESKMKITKRQLRRLIREALTPSTPEEKKAYQTGLKDQGDGRYDHYFEPESLRNFYDAGQDAGEDGNPTTPGEGLGDDAEIEYAAPQHNALSGLLELQVEDGDEKFFVISPPKNDDQGEFRHWQNDRIGLLKVDIASDDYDAEREYTAEDLAQWLKTQGAKVG